MFTKTKIKPIKDEFGMKYTGKMGITESDRKMAEKLSATMNPYKYIGHRDHTPSKIAHKTILDFVKKTNH